MHEYQTADSVANRVRMLRSADRSKAFLIVEGSQDCRVYGLFACPTRCAVQWGYGREKALNAGRLLHNEGFVGFVVAMDQDHWVIDKAYPADSFVVWTDGRDLESTLMFAGVAERIISNFTRPDVLKDIERDTGKRLLNHLIDWCAALGAMRWVIIRGRLGLSCKEIDAFQSVERATMQVSLERLAHSIIDSATGPLPDSRPRLSNRIVFETRQLLERAGEEKWLYCRGHDLCHALASGLRGDFGDDLCDNLTAEIVEASVRSAYSWSDFEETTLHRRIREWEASNEPWRILADRRRGTAVG